MCSEVCQQDFSAGRIDNEVDPPALAGPVFVVVYLDVRQVIQQGTVEVILFTRLVSIEQGYVEAVFIMHPVLKTPTDLSALSMVCFCRSCENLNVVQHAPWMRVTVAETIAALQRVIMHLEGG
jgi:hypothetical protein